MLFRYNRSKVIRNYILQSENYFLLIVQYSLASDISVLVLVPLRLCCYPHLFCIAYLQNTLISQIMWMNTIYMHFIFLVNFDQGIDGKVVRLLTGANRTQLDSAVYYIG